jgi:hypothetical protein
VRDVFYGDENNRGKNAHEQERRQDGGKNKGFFAHAAQVLAFYYQPGFVHDG